MVLKYIIWKFLDENIGSVLWNTKKWHWVQEIAVEGWRQLLPSVYRRILWACLASQRALTRWTFCLVQYSHSYVLPFLKANKYRQIYSSVHVVVFHWVNDRQHVCPLLRKLRGKWWERIFAFMFYLLSLEYERRDSLWRACSPSKAHCV